MLILAITVGAVVLGGIISMGLIKNTKVKAIAEVAKVGIEKTRDALVDDNKISKEEVVTIFEGMVAKAKELISG